MNRKNLVVALGVASLVVAFAAAASSHREAPGITNSPKDDNTDVYAFRSYEAGKSGTTTLIANFQPFQDPFGGPNYFLMDENAVYSINIDNNGDAVADITYEFRFFNQFKNITVPVNGVPVADSVEQHLSVQRERYARPERAPVLHRHRRDAELAAPLRTIRSATRSFTRSRSTTSAPSPSRTTPSTPMPTSAC